MVLFSFAGPVNSEPPRTKKDGRNEAACHRRGTANTEGASAPNGAGSAVDGTPRTAMVSVDWFGLTGARNRPVFSETGRASARREGLQPLAHRVRLGASGMQMSQ